MKLFKKVLLFLLVATLLSASAFAATGAPNGEHYNLNIIGVQNPKTAEMIGANGHVIFVPLTGKAKIELVMGDDYRVLDANATDGSPAQFMLPDPGLDPYVIGDPGTADTISAYSVFVRPLGKPGGWSTITTCAEIADSKLMEFFSNKEVKVLNEAAYFGGVASVEQVGQMITERKPGKSTFTNVTAELLTIVLRVEVEVAEDVWQIFYVRVPLFDPILESQYWEYDNKGLKLLQVRFYPIGTDVTYADLVY